MKRIHFIWLILLGLVMLLAPPLPMASAVVNCDETSNTTGQIQAIVQDGGASVIKSMTSQNTTVDAAFQDLNTTNFIQEQATVANMSRSTVATQTEQTSMLTPSPEYPIIKPLVARNKSWFDSGQHGGYVHFLS